MTATLLDLFAGTGVGVAARSLGIHDYGVDNWQPVIDTREANGFETIFRDVWDGLTGKYDIPDHDILWASPSCQTFSMAGLGAGRRALSDVIQLIEDGAYERYDDMRAFALAHGDERTALVLTPLSYAMKFRPRAIVLEQVPPVLPVWQAYADVLRQVGYSVITGHLQAEQYGVPQTRRRAFLVARRDGIEAQMPTPTHSRYYPRNPAKLDPGVKPWVSMAEALGWDEDEGERHMRSNYGSGGDPANRGERGALEPAPTVTSKIDRNKWIHHRPSTTVVGTFRPDVIAGPGYRKAGDGPRQNAPGSVNVTFQEAAALQTYPSDFVWVGKKSEVFLQIGNAVPVLLAKAVLSTLL